MCSTSKQGGPKAHNQLHVNIVLCHTWPNCLHENEINVIMSKNSIFCGLIVWGLWLHLLYSQDR